MIGMVSLYSYFINKLFLTFVFKIPGLGSSDSLRDVWAFFTLSLIPGSPSTLVNHDGENDGDCSFSITILGPSIQHIWHHSNWVT